MLINSYLPLLDELVTNLAFFFFHPHYSPIVLLWSVVVASPCPHCLPMIPLQLVMAAFPCSHHSLVVLLQLVAVGPPSYHSPAVLLQSVAMTSPYPHCSPVVLLQLSLIVFLDAISWLAVAAWKYLLFNFFYHLIAF